MLFLKPIFRTVFLSIILALLIIYLGIKYHWSDYLKADESSKVSSLEIPPLSKNNLPSQKTTIQNSVKPEVFVPEIIPLNHNNDLISSMNKDQVEMHCKSLLSKSIKNDDQLNLAVVNCMVSNYQEPLQTIRETSIMQKREKFRQTCQKQFANNKKYSNIEIQLLIGICTSDIVTQ
ncbi:hypothetical protein [uncultured Cocleimonas sp.]|uniref:hypothetical protein n=1 Tax=uncultured Cocleimonas sp. TaxID=1051587 RepID=UPI00261FE41C|nr:hypothetical protein [uncultured Cocleimonas sp.]